MITILDVKHVETVTERPFDEVVAALHAVTGSVENSLYALAAGSGDTSTFTKTFEDHEGRSGFMRFLEVDHGAMLTRFYERPTRALLIIIGNPLLAITMLKPDVGAGLNVPTRMYILQGDDGRTRVVYDLPSTQMSYLNAEARGAAEELDAKFIDLVTDITGVAEPV